MSTLELTKLCTTCTGIFTGRWSPQTNGWKRAPRKVVAAFDPEPAFGTAYDHGMEPYVHGHGAPPTLSYPHHTVAELRVSAASCPLCRIVELFFDAPDGLDNAIMDYMDGRKPVGKDRWSNDEIEKARGYVFQYTEEGQRSKLIFRYQVQQHWEDTRNKDINPTIGEREGNLNEVKLELYDVGDEQNKCLIDWKNQGTTLERVSKWLDDDKGFQKHLPKHLPKELPTRLLHIASGSPDPIVRLINSKDTNLDPNTTYIALSHSWGKSMPLRLVQNKLADFQKGIPFADLPKTFQDAAKLTLDLGQAYLWIDSLCIIQDSASDWLYEAQRMATVYAFSHLTIAASASVSTETGLSPVPRPRTVIVRPTWTGMINDMGMRPPQTFRIDDGFFTRFFHSITTAPLNRRGWTYQEYTLSPRVLHCTEGEWWWSSFTSPHIHRESSTEAVSFFTGPISLSWPDSRSLYDVKPRTYPPTSPVTIWSTFASQYNQRALTMRRDKMVAFGAVAEIFGRLNNLPIHKPNEYVAGCWRTYLPQGLQWMVAERTERYVITPGEQDEKYVIPSWSWASVNGLVRWVRGGTDDDSDRDSDSEAEQASLVKTPSGMPKLVDVAVTTEGGAFGPVTGGHIVLRGPLFRIRAAKETTQVEIGAWFRRFDILAADDTKVAEIDGQLFTLDSWVGRVDTWDKDREMYCAVVMEEQEDFGETFGIILERVKGQGNGVYKRIGSTHVDWDGSKEVLRMVREGGRKGLAEEEYMKMDEARGHCTYKII
ncbi:heterokaryon incompatibility protein-domain-containing protein [Thelonectria olida]|uniref:Heterokaryon incompatibility protein-domain-containing protein n=1 Tax=Thelonectria olida TaxID=1576542 RepID=A0A9P8W6X9_9HYPO|nr:heterokaryon incompatibility protein-domain-containing protein [Thelonectria olida]